MTRNPKEGLLCFAFIVWLVSGLDKQKTEKPEIFWTENPFSTQCVIRIGKLISSAHEVYGTDMHNQNSVTGVYNLVSTLSMSVPNRVFYRFYFSFTKIDALIRMLIFAVRDSKFKFRPLHLLNLPNLKVCEFSSIFLKVYFHWKLSRNVRVYLASYSETHIRLYTFFLQRLIKFFLSRCSADAEPLYRNIA